MKKVKFFKDGIVCEGNLIEDKLFSGGKKIEFVNEEGTTCVYSIDIIKIIDDEYSGSTRN
jgi:hypothetical protein